MNAVTACPSCGVVAMHYLRAPNPNNDGRPRRITGPDGEYVEFRVWGRRPIDERRYRAIRECQKCRHTWGIHPKPKDTTR